MKKTFLKIFVLGMFMAFAALVYGQDVKLPEPIRIHCKENLGRFKVGEQAFLVNVRTSNFGDLRAYFKKDQENLPYSSHPKTPSHPAPSTIGKKVGDTILLAEQIYKILAISIEQESLIIRASEKREKVIGGWVGQYLPHVPRQDLQGDTLSMEDIQGKYLFLDFWSHSCRPCIEAIPALKELYEKLDPEKIQMLSIAIEREEDVDKVQKVVDKYGIKWLNLIEFQRYAMKPNSFQSSMAISSYPTYLIVDPEGKIIARAGFSTKVKLWEMLEGELKHLQKNKD